MYAENMSESFGHEYVQMFVRTKWSFLKSFISRNAMSITHFPAMPLALSATSSYFVDRDLPLARSLFPSLFPRSKSGIRYVSARWNIGLSRKDQRTIEIYGRTRLALVYLYIPNMSYLATDIYDCTKHIRMLISYLIISLLIVQNTESVLSEITEFKNM